MSRIYLPPMRFSPNSHIIAHSEVRHVARIRRIPGEKSPSYKKRRGRVEVHNMKLNHASYVPYFDVLSVSRRSALVRNRSLTPLSIEAEQGATWK
jgi:hypothetical protein